MVLINHRDVLRVDVRMVQVIHLHILWEGVHGLLDVVDTLLDLFLYLLGALGLQGAGILSLFVLLEDFESELVVFLRLDILLLGLEDVSPCLLPAKNDDLLEGEVWLSWALWVDWGASRAARESWLCACCLEIETIAAELGLVVIGQEGLLVLSKAWLCSGRAIALIVVHSILAVVVDKILKALRDLGRWKAVKFVNLNSGSLSFHLVIFDFNFDYRLTTLLI